MSAEYDKRMKLIAMRHTTIVAAMDAINEKMLAYTRSLQQDPEANHLSTLVSFFDFLGQTVVCACRLVQEDEDKSILIAKLSGCYKTLGLELVAKATAPAEGAKA